MSIIEKYDAASKLLLKNTKKAVLNGNIKVTFLDEHSFYYAKESKDGGIIHYTYMKYDILNKCETPLFDHDDLKSKLGVSYITFNISLKDSIISFKHQGKSYTYDINNHIIMNYPTIKEEAKVSSKYYTVYTKDYNLYAFNKETKQTVQLTFDGEYHNDYAGHAEVSEHIKRQKMGVIEYPGVLFSNDGKKIITYQIDQRDVKDLYVIEAFDKEGSTSIRPKLHTYKCAFPEDDIIPLCKTMIFNLETNERIDLDIAPYTTGYGLFSSRSSVAYWCDDDKHLVTTWRSRGDKDAKLYLVDTTTGKAECIVHEHTDTFLNLGTYGQMDGFGSYSFSNFITKDLQLAFFQSERDDYARYFAYNVSTKECLGPITPGNIIANAIKYVDEDSKTIYFMANCIEGSSDPYYEYLCKVNFDGSNFKVLSKADAFHTIQMNKSYFIDTYSRVDLKPQHDLYDNDGNFISTIIESDISELLALGYVMPERFKVTASDGKTDLYGIIIKPDLKDGEVVPYVDHMYGGMQCYFVPKQFTYDNSMGREIFGGLQSYAKLGIAGIMLDGLGTPGRGKKLHDISYENIHGCAGLKDHVYVADQLKALYPFLDIDNVGIWGNSGGGCATSRALLEYPDYFKVGVSSAGNHDQRMYSNGWTERYYGLYKEDIYLQGDNTALAKNFKGKLLIVHGMMDDNVTMPQSIRLIDALINANKTFDFFILPRVDHNVPADPYFQRRKMDYFVEHLLHITPPHDYQF